MATICADGLNLGSWGCAGWLGIAQTVSSVIAVSAILASMGFGLMALFAKYRDEHGRPTRYGRIAAAGVVLTAVFSLASNWLNSYIASAKATRESREVLARYDAQMGRLASSIVLQQNALRESYALRGGLERSLTRQGDQLRLAEATSSDLAANTRASMANADRLLRSLWESAEAIDGSDLAVRLETNCLFPQGEGLAIRNMMRDRPVPSIFGPSPRLSLSVRARGASGSAVRLATGHNWQGVAQRRLAVQPADDSQRNFSFASGTTEIVEFTDFVLNAPSPLLRLSVWNGAVLQLDFEDFSDWQMGRELAKWGWEPDKAKGAVVPVDDRVSRLWEGRDTRQLILAAGQRLTPCIGDAIVRLRGQEVGRIAGRFITSGEVRQNSRRSGLYLIMPPIEVANDAFPTFRTASR